MHSLAYTFFSISTVDIAKSGNPPHLKKRLESAIAKCHMLSRLPYSGTIISFRLSSKYESSLGSHGGEHCLSLIKQSLEED